MCPGSSARPWRPSSAASTARRQRRPPRPPPRSSPRAPGGDQPPPIATLWRRHWEYIRPVFAYPPAIRRLLYTTNAIESLHMQLRKIIKTRGHFPTDEAAMKVLYPALPHIAVLFGERFTMEG